MQEKEQNYWLALCRTPGLGPISQRRLLEKFGGTPEQLFIADRKILQANGLKSKTLKYFQSPDWQEIERDLAWLEQPNHHLITIVDKRYPPLLKEIPDAPIVLFICGDPELIQSIQVGVVGSRNPSSGGKRIAYEFSKQIAQCGITVTSGMALGIDYSSHLGALDVGKKTIAVLGNGLDIIYPARHKQLVERIVEQGALISEFPIGVKPLAKNFPRRNRIISGLSTGVLVVEAAQQSGSLITAKYAMEQGREVFAIPGSIHNPLSKGCHSLIKQGAKLVENVQEIIDELGPLIHTTIERAELKEYVSNNTKGIDDDGYKHLLNVMAYESISIDQLIEHTGLTADVVSSMLLTLELAGLITASPGGLYVRVN